MSTVYIVFNYVNCHFFSCEKDNLEQTLRKIISKESKIENKNQALFVSMKLLHGDLKQVREENPHLVLGNVSISRKMGFPEVILPGDVRNDLYLTLVNGEFAKGNKKSDKNVEVVVKVCNEKGQPIPVSLFFYCFDFSLTFSVYSCLIRINIKIVIYWIFKLFKGRNKHGRWNTTFERVQIRHLLPRR